MVDRQVQFLRQANHIDLVSDIHCLDTHLLCTLQMFEF
jgi:hypothetical protein